MNPAYENILITGGAGNLGRHVYEELLEAGYKVTLFDQRSPAEAPVPWQCKTLFVKGALTDLGDCMRAITLARATCIIHLGALPNDSDKRPEFYGTPRGVQMLPEDTTMQSNVMGTYYVMDAARRLGVRKVIFASSFFVLGLGFRVSNDPFKVEYLPMDEEHPNRPEDTYSLSKIMGEEIVHAYCRAYGIKGVALRLMGISYPYRPHQMQYSIADSKDPGHVGGPNKGTTSQFVDARDVAQACRLAVEKDLESEFEPFFINTDNHYTDDPKLYVANMYPDLVDMARDLGPEDGLISDKKLQTMLGYKPKFSWRHNDLEKINDTSKAFKTKP